MSNTVANGKHVKVALQEVDTTNFEKFGQAFYAALRGTDFVPLGGMHDGGAEGFVEPELFEDANATHFLQISKQATYKDKIKKTVERLRGYGRNPNSLTYITSQTIPAIDKIEEELSDALSCRIRIRDANYIEMQINSSPATIAAFYSYLAPALAIFSFPGVAKVASRAGEHSNRTMAVFLRQEVESRHGSDILESVSDSLIIWSLSDTDPAAGKFMTRGEILSRIESTLPSARQFIRGVLDSRLEYLRTRQSGRDRQIRHYTVGDKYCLPFEMREQIQQENIDDVSLKLEVSALLERRCLAISTDDESKFAKKVVEVCHATFERIYEQQGLQIAQFAYGNEEDESLYKTAAEIVTAVTEEGVPQNDFDLVRRLATATLRGTFYDGTQEERLYLQKLSQTYVLLLLLKNEPRVVEYFKSLTSHFTLYIGTDFLVRALSEHYLAEENQTTRNLFSILRNAGATLVLTEKSVEELASHLRRQIFEFRNIYEHTESRVTYEEIQYIDRILIRAYFYARLSPIAGVKPPLGWRNFVEQFGSYDALLKEEGNSALAQYLVTRFGMVYETYEEMHQGISEEEVRSLSNEIIKERWASRSRLKDKAGLLADNDALQVCRIYQRRKVDGENSPSNPFGFKTWWLTLDAGVRRAAAALITANHGHRFMMRPEFLLNYIYLVPSAHEVVSSFRSIFPSVLGVRLANRVHAETFRSVMKKANEIWSVDEARAGAMITECVNLLKGGSIRLDQSQLDRANK